MLLFKVYHGTGNLKMNKFDGRFTGKGNDQLGSGFYFTTSLEEASQYAAASRSSNAGVISAEVKLEKPIVMRRSHKSLADSVVELTHRQALAVIKQSPKLYDLAESPLGDWYDIWDEGIQDWMIVEVAKAYTGPSFTALEGDWFKHDSQKFRYALRKASGYDGVLKRYDRKHLHVVAWFPDQIRITKRTLESKL